jgi:hypothetical protein
VYEPSDADEDGASMLDAAIRERQHERDVYAVQARQIRQMAKDFIRRADAAGMSSTSPESWLDPLLPPLCGYVIVEPVHQPASGSGPGSEPEWFATGLFLSRNCRWFVMDHTGLRIGAPIDEALPRDFVGEIRRHLGGRRPNKEQTSKAVADLLAGILERAGR